ncbi:MAG: cytochrome P450 [Gammaproteobacteria bacterium]|nr:cytochrome P450 [Gammaproteobacteria bacterium]
MNVDDQLNDPAFFATDRYYALFDRLRAEDPVHWTTSPDGRGYWSVFKHADFKHILNEPELYSSEREGVMPAVDAEMSAVAKQAMGVGENVLTIDPPRHGEMRKVVSEPFLPRALAAAEARTRTLIGGIFDGLPADGEIDLVTDLAVRIPMAVICDILDLPEGDWDKLLGWGKMAIGGSDPEYRQGTAAETVSQGYQLLYDYSLRTASARRGCPFADPLTALANATVGGRPMTPSEIAHNGTQLMLAGFETTRNAFSGGVLALLENPDQMALLREDPKRLRLGVEEFVRWSDPVISLMRTATGDTELRGRRIRAGDRVMLWFPSANRDEEVFDQPYRFDITRHPNLHVGFGGGPHFCLGGPLAKLEIRLAMEELLERYDGLEITGPVERVQSSFVGGLKHLPVRLRQRTARASAG